MKDMFKNEIFGTLEPPHGAIIKMPPPNTPVRLPEIPPRRHPKPEKPQGR